VKRYGGNYSQFEVLRAQQLALQQSAYEKQQKTIEHLQSFVDRFKAKATKAKQAQSRMKALEKMELIAPAHIASPFTFEFRTPDAAPNPMLVMEDVRCGYHADDGAEIPIVERVTLSIQNGQRIGLLGANGQGKSTLIKTLAGTLAPLSGHVREGKGLTIGYFAQHQLETLREDDSPLAASGPARARHARAGAARLPRRLQFPRRHGDVADRPVLGRREGAAGAALIIWQKPNLLLLDEPTNHLDLETRTR
jgi:ATP-binding cassette subfamily F protein 3